MIPGILELNSKTKYGMSSRNVPSYLFRPLDTSLGLCIVGCSRKDTTSNVLALINVEHWSEDLTKGNLTEIIGKCGDMKAEELALLYQYSVRPWKKFKEPLIIPSLIESRLVTGYAFNIDPEGCRDIDDVILIGDDGYTYIVIADVCSWVSLNKKYFEIASSVGQTLYKDGQVIAPLIPFEEELSLLPGKLRRGVALKFKWNGSITELAFERITFTNTESFTYDSIYESPHVQFLMTLTSYLAREYLEDSHRWIETLMIFYNKEAAKILVKKKQGFLRAQSAPDIEKYQTYKDLGVDVEILANKAAEYVYPSDDALHWGFSTIYCHATSPIRRFADIINQMVVCDETPLDCSLEILNERGKKSKKYERDLFFLHKVVESREVTGISLNDHRVWIPEWKRIITCSNTVEPGTKGRIVYSVNLNQSTWKRRLAFRFEDIDY